jgi:signal transduction histidine kinase
MAPSPSLEAPSVRRLRYVAVGGPLLLLAGVEIAQALLAPLLSPWVTRLLVFAVALALLALFYDQVFGRLAKLEQRLQRQNRELLELHAAALVVTADLSLDTVLQTIVERARALLGTRYGAISVVDQSGGISSFVTSGIDHQLELAIGEPPRGRGVLGVALHEGQRLRLDDISKDPRSVGFPPGHPPMRSLLAVPVVCRVPYHGNLYLSEKEGGGGFTADDEEVLVRFADQAAVAIDNAYLYGQVRELGAARERLRIAHEMHDGLAQVLAYVNTKAQVVREYLRQGRSDEAQKHLDEFAEAARNLYGDVRQQILELRSTRPEEGGLVAAVADYAQGWGQQTGVETELSLPPALELAVDVQKQLLRILQEALANVRKHARAGKVLVAMEQDSVGLRLRVTDDGAGFDPEARAASPGGRFGLKTMTERAASIGATVIVASRPGEGTRVEVTLPRMINSRRETLDAPPAS